MLVVKVEKSGLAFHCHHDTLFEYVYDFKERVDHIKTYKPERERELRLRLFKLIPKDKIPGRDSVEWEAYVKAWMAYVKAWKALDKAREAYDKAGEAHGKAWKAYAKVKGAYVKAWEALVKVKGAYNKAWEAYVNKYLAKLESLHRELCPDCPWDGKTIFPLTNR